MAIKLLFVVLPVTVLVINLLLIWEMRRAFNDNIGLQQHHQSQHSHSAVPTATLVTTSLVCVLLRGSISISSLISRDYYVHSNLFANHCRQIFNAVSYFVFAYNFYVYLLLRCHAKRLADKNVSKITYVVSSGT